MPNRAGVLGSSLRWAESAWFLIRRILAAVHFLSSHPSTSSLSNIPAASRGAHIQIDSLSSRFPRHFCLYSHSLLFVPLLVPLHSSSLAHAPRLSAFHSTPSSVSGPLLATLPPFVPESLRSYIQFTPRLPSRLFSQLSACFTSLLSHQISSRDVYCSCSRHPYEHSLLSANIASNQRNTIGPVPTRD
ncbi:hypothetical protein HDV62DRAFT_267713 [Trichoderma sp. SZMC 28011]